MKKWQIIAAVSAVIIIVIFIFFPKIVDLVMRSGLNINQGGPGICASLQPGEWMPERGECPSQNAELSAKCDAFCLKHPDCCGNRAGGDRPFGGQEKIFTLPSAKVIAGLKRVYPATIKALNQGPNIYSRGVTSEILSQEKLAAIKAVGFNTIQVLLIGKKDSNGKLVFNEVNNSVLLNDIVAIKKSGLAVWVALDIAGVPPDLKTGSLGDYVDFKSSFSAFTKRSAELMEKYKVEYFTVANEPDKPFKEQIAWGANVNAYLADFMPTANAVAREKFSGKLINKITQSEKHTKEVIAASFKNVDIAGLDVGPAMDTRTNFVDYQKRFNEYQFYATLAEAAGVPWMNAEYWQGDFDRGYTDFAKNNQLKYAQVSFGAYLKVTPKGMGYVWNDWATFSLPQGEATKQALKEFFEKI